MKTLKKTLRHGLFIICISVLAGSCKPFRFVVYNTADIKDYKKFPKRDIANDTVHFTFPVSQNPKYPKTIAYNENKQITFDEFLKENKTVAFLIIKDDSIQYENYFKGYDKQSIVPSFSVAKSVVSMLVGFAIQDGYIKSVDEPITNYVSGLHSGMEKVTIKHLLQMTSGIKFNESYWNPFGHAASFYYGRNLRKECKKLKPEKPAGIEFNYKSGDTQLLGWVLENALKGKTVAQYLQEKIWQPMQMEYSASWSLDKNKNGLEKTFCCLNARASDYAKLGRLYLEKGNWNGKQLLNKEWIEQSTQVDTTNGSEAGYQYGWWLPSDKGDYMAVGILGQYVYVNPSKNLIIVRLGKGRGDVNWGWVFGNLAESY